MNIDFGKYFLFIFAILLIVASTFSCEEEAPILSRTNKIIADSIVRVNEKIIRTEIDSLCKIAYQNNFDKAVDSISARRLREIENYIPKRK